MCRKPAYYKIFREKNPFHYHKDKKFAKVAVSAKFFRENKKRP